MSNMAHEEDDGEAAERVPGSQASECLCRSGASECERCTSLSCDMRVCLESWMREDTASWRAAAYSSYAYLRDELARLRPSLRVEQSIATSVERALDEALLAMVPPRRRPGGQKSGWRAPWVWLQRLYSGSDIEQTWRAIHRAQAALYVIYEGQALVPQAEHVEAVIAELPEQTSLLKSVTNLISQIAPASSSAPIVPGEQGAMLRGIYERAMDISDNLQVEARGLRNVLLTASAASCFVVVTLGFAHVFDPKIVELCVHVAAGKNACPLGGSRHPLDVFTIELAGMLGGLLSIVIPLATGERIKTPYRVFNQQLILKLVVGAASALGGVILIVGGVIDTIKLSSTTAILGYAIVLGFAQQIVTGAVDRRADSLAKQTPTAKSV
jgi:hypothetical protein